MENVYMILQQIDSGNYRYVSNFIRTAWVL